MSGYLTKRQALNIVKDIARELEYRMERNLRYPEVKYWAMDGTSSTDLANDAQRISYFALHPDFEENRSAVLFIP